MKSRLPDKFFFLVLCCIVFLFSSKIALAASCPTVGSNLAGNWDEDNLKFIRDNANCTGPIPVNIIITPDDLKNTETNSGKLMIQHIKDLAAKYNLNVSWRGWGNPQDYDPVTHPELINGLKVLSGQQFYPGNEQNYCIAESCPNGTPSPQAVALVHKHLIEAGLGIKVVIPPLNTLNPDGAGMMEWKKFMTSYAQTCPECIRSATFAAANIYAPPQARNDVAAWANSAKEYYNFLKNLGFNGKLVITEAGVNPGQYADFGQRLQDTIAFASRLEELLKTDSSLAGIIDKVTFLIMDDKTGKQYFIHRVCDATGCRWEIVDYLTLNTNIPGLVPYIQPEEIICTNPSAEEGPFRPEPCTDCGRPVDQPTFSCSQSFEVSQDTWVDVGYGGSSMGEMFSCPSGSVDGSFGFKRDWGGQVVVDTKNTTLPFANYREKQTDQESKYLAAYFTGTVNRYGPECDLKDPACVTDVFNKSGVMSKLLPQEKQDELRCDMLKKVSQGKEFDYEVTEGRQTFNVSDFYNVPSNNILEITQLHAAPCAEPKPTGVDPSSDLYAEYLREHKIWEQRKQKEWDNTVYSQLWPYIPMVTYKDAPGVLSLISQGPPGYFANNNFALSFPHLGTLFEASQIVQEALAPYYEESTLTGANSQPVLLASAKTDEVLKEKIYQNSSACAAPQVLGTNTMLAQTTTQTPQQSYLTVSIEIERVDRQSNRVYYGVRIFQNGPKRGHQMLNGQDIGPGEHGDSGYYLSSQDSNWSGVLPAAVINADGTFTIPNIHTWNHILSDENSPWFATRDITESCSGTVDTATGQITSTTCIPKTAGQTEPEIRCGNPDNIDPGSCEDPDAKEDEDDNPEDAVCSNPYPIVANLEVPDYSGVMSAEQLEDLQEKAHGCRTACQKDDNSPNCQPPCSWQQFSTLNRKIGVDLNLPYLERIGQLTISNFYRYEYDKNQKGEFTPNAFTTYEPGIFDYFRPNSMLHFPLYEAKSDISYSYAGGHSNSGVSGSKSEASLIASTQNASLEEGEIYYPWLGGVQWAKKCIAESGLIPEEMSKSEYCPEMGTDTRNPTTDSPPLAPSLDSSSEFYGQEQKIESGQEENEILDLPEQIEKVENPEQLAGVLQAAGYKQYQIDRIISNIPAYQQAQRQTGIPWQVFAAINGVETNFNSNNPKGNSDGPMQVTGSNYAAGKTNSYEEFVDVLVDSSSVIKSKIAIARNLGLIDSQKKYSQFTQTDWAQVAYLYNGRPSEKTGPDGKTYYGTEVDSWKNSGYVSNGSSGNSNMWVSDGKGGWVNMKTNKGFLTNYQTLKKLGL